MGEREMGERVGKRRGGQKEVAGERKREGALGRWKLRVPPSQTLIPEPYLRPEGNGVKERWASYSFSFRDTHSPVSLPPLQELLISLFHLLPAFYSF